MGGLNLHPCISRMVLPSLKTHANGRNTVDQQHAILLGLTCCIASVCMEPQQCWYSNGLPVKGPFTWTRVGCQPGSGHQPGSTLLQSNVFNCLQVTRVNPSCRVTCLETRVDPPWRIAKVWESAQKIIETRVRPTRVNSNDSFFSQKST